MKKLFSLLSIVAVIVISNCSEIPENNDPILGIWSQSQENLTTDTLASTEREEWIFNDVFLGRYQRYSGSQVVFFTDFAWERTEDDYSIEYRHDDVTDVTVRLETIDETDQLTLQDGNTFAIRQ